jgi:hypothetical protein
METLEKWENLYQLLFDADERTKNPKLDKFCDLIYVDNLTLLHDYFQDWTI